jgi:DNA mismatch endonuclease (patch repair protein)
MRAVRSKDTQPELAVRSIVRSLGYSYRLHSKSLPGRPDIVVAGAKKAIFVHGCFWHGHNCKRGARVPKSNTDYWVTKISRNTQRDAQARRELRKRGWKILVIWECELKAAKPLLARVRRFLS